ncbi:sensor domain-containing diguanylate cyclase [Chitinimonas sp.]|uniref:sensor domain-containing diguanylate cyclase n=1 Tax=Chitinimonas sp. TaxID=1934313 RepID=UPI002F92A5F2
MQSGINVDPLLAKLSTAVPAARSLEQLTRPLLEMLGAVTGLESTYLTVIDADNDVQHVRYARNTGDMTIPEGLSVPWGDTLCKRALDEGRMYTDNVADCWGDSEAAKALGIQTYVSTPVRNGDGELLGTLCAASAQKHGLAPGAEAVLRLFSSLVGTFIERERLVKELQTSNEQLRSFAMTDALTGLPNRRALFDELQRMLAQAEREHSCVLVAVIDLDGFKGINDRYGHQSGDHFLQAMSRRLTATLRASDCLARVGGDEFVLIAPGPHNDEALTAAHALQERIAAATIGRFELGTQVLDYAGASVGAVAVDPEGLAADEAIRLADAQMYEVKRTRKRSRAS